MSEDLYFMKCKEHNVKYPSHLECPGCKKDKEKEKELNHFQKAVKKCIEDGAKIRYI